MLDLLVRIDFIVMTNGYIPVIVSGRLPRTSVRFNVYYFSPRSELLLGPVLFALHSRGGRTRLRTVRAKQRP